MSPFAKVLGNNVCSVSPRLSYGKLKNVQRVWGQFWLFWSDSFFSCLSHFLVWEIIEIEYQSMDRHGRERWIFKAKHRIFYSIRASRQVVALRMMFCFVILCTTAPHLPFHSSPRRVFPSQYHSWHLSDVVLYRSTWYSRPMGRSLVRVNQVRNQPKRPC